jgi:hypothetical protein
VFLLTNNPRSGGLAMGGRRGESTVVSVLGGARRVPHGRFRGARVTSFMGSSVLDLRRATLDGGEEATIELLAVMGSVILRVPDGWVVDTKAMPVIGGVTDARGPHALPAERDLAAPVAAQPRLVLHGAILMAGLRITS